MNTCGIIRALSPRSGPVQDPILTATEKEECEECVRSVSAHQSGEPAIVSAPKLTCLYRRHSSYVSAIDSCITQLEAQGPSRTSNESKEEEEDRMAACE